MPATDETFAFLLQHADTHIATAIGVVVEHHGPLPPVGIRYVAGTARSGGFRPHFTLPAGEVLLSSDHSHVAVRQEALWRVFDLATGREGFRFESDGPTFLHALHPSGEMLARRTDARLDLLLPDGRLWRTLAVQRRRLRYRKLQPFAEEMLTFTACGGYLWFAACPADGPDGLWLLDVPMWRVLERGPLPPSIDNPNRCRPEILNGWWENEMAIHPGTGWLAISRWAGDSFLSFTFHRAENGRRVDHEHCARVDDRPYDGENICPIAPAPAGRWITLGYDTQIYVWDWPSIKPIACVHPPDDLEDSLFQGMAAACGSVLAWGDDGGILVFRAPTLERLLTPEPAARADELLPNGAIVQYDGGSRRLLTWEQGEENWSAVLELDTDTRRCRAVWSPRGGTWRDVSAEVAWCEPAFPFSERR